MDYHNDNCSQEDEHRTVIGKMDYAMQIVANAILLTTVLVETWRRVGEPPLILLQYLGTITEY